MMARYRTPTALTPELQALLDALTPTASASASAGSDGGSAGSVFRLPSLTPGASPTVALTPDLLFELANDVENSYSTASQTAVVSDKTVQLVTTPELAAAIADFDVDASTTGPSTGMGEAAGPLAELGALSTEQLAAYLMQNSVALELAKAAVATPVAAQPAKRKRAPRRFVPTELKDAKYWQRRAKNNEAARKARLRKKLEKQAKLQAAVAKEQLAGLVGAQLR